MSHFKLVNFSMAQYQRHFWFRCFRSRADSNLKFRFKAGGGLRVGNESGGNDTGRVEEDLLWILETAAVKLNGDGGSARSAARKQIVHHVLGIGEGGKAGE